MADGSKIEWTDATWNPVRGCSRVSPGCGGANHQGGCYAETIAARFSGPGLPFEGFAERTVHGGRWTGKLALVDDLLTVPLRWKKPRRIFVNSMSDLFHENLPDAAIDKVFAVMALAPWHTFQVLTKRADRMRAYMAAAHERIAKAAMELAPVGRDISTTGLMFAPMQQPSTYFERWPLSNVWLGVSVEDQQRADERIPELLATPAAVRFLSCEPLLGPLVLHYVKASGGPVIDALAGEHWHQGAGSISSVTVTGKPKLDWVIAGGESGPNSRPAHPDWFRSLRDQCAAAGVPFFFKQWGEWAPGEAFGLCSDGPVHDSKGNVRDWMKRYVVCADRADRLDGHSFTEHATNLVYRVGKKRAGATLDGREHREFPTWQSSP